MISLVLSKALHLTAAFALISGVGLAAAGAPVYGSLSGVGTSVVYTKVPSGEMLQATDAIAIAHAYQAADAAIQLILGMLLILLGFFMHGFARVQDERHVHITVKPSQKKPGGIWYWMELHI